MDQLKVETRNRSLQCRSEQRQIYKHIVLAERERSVYACVVDRLLFLWYLEARRKIPEMLLLDSGRPFPLDDAPESAWIIRCFARSCLQRSCMKHQFSIDMSLKAFSPSLGSHFIADEERQ